MSIAHDKSGIKTDYTEMATDNSNNDYKKITGLIKDRNLHEAFNQLRAKATSYSLMKISDRINHLEETYKYLIHYFIEGYNDEGREEMLSRIISGLCEINDSLLRESAIIDRDRKSVV